jgi:hypothetical protein
LSWLILRISIYSTRPDRSINDVNNQLTRLISKDPNTADQNPCTSNPEIKIDTKFNKNALMINVKKPSDKRFIGSVTINSMGRINALRIPRIAAAKKAERNPVEWIPSNR